MDQAVRACLNLITFGMFDRIFSALHICLHDWERIEGGHISPPTYRYWALWRCRQCGKEERRVYERQSLSYEGRS